MLARFVIQKRENTKKRLEAMINTLSTYTVAMLTIIAFALTFNSTELKAQDDGGRIVFTDPKSKDDKTLSEDALDPNDRAWGVDLMIGDDGFGLGFFYHFLLTDVTTLFLTTSFSETKDPDQVEQIGFFGETLASNKLNHIFRIPLFVGLQYRLFKDDIVENFRPFVNGGAGPVMMLVSPAVINGEREDFFGSIGYAQAKYTFGGFLGAGAQFGFDRSSILGVNIRYYIIPTPDKVAGIAVRDPETDGFYGKELPNANGFFITLNLGTTF